MYRRILTRVDDVASEWGDAGSGSSEAYTTALAPLRDSTSGLGGARCAAGCAGAAASASASSGAGAGEGRADVTVLDVRENDLGVRALGLDLGGDTGGGGAGAAGNTGRGGVLVGRVVGVEPEHARSVVVPDGEREDHAAAEGLTELRQTAVLVEVVGVSEDGLLLHAEVLGD